MTPANSQSNTTFAPGLHLVVEGPIATVMLDRPDQHNAVTAAMWRALPSLCHSINANPAVHVVIWRGAGEAAFSAGGDITEFSEHRSNREQAIQYNAQVAAALESVLTLRPPILAVIKGYCVGGGLLLAGHCDLRIAADNARFGLPVARLGFPLTYPQLQRFVHLIGVAALSDLLLTARLVGAEEARVLGLCTQVHPLGAIEAAVEKQAHTMAGLSPLVQARHKQMLQTVLHKPDLTRLDAAEIALLDAMFDSEDYAEGLNAFVEKRPPHFTGR